MTATKGLCAARPRPPAGRRLPSGRSARPGGGASRRAERGSGRTPAPPQLLAPLRLPGALVAGYGGPCGRRHPQPLRGAAERLSLATKRWAGCLAHVTANGQEAPGNLRFTIDSMRWDGVPRRRPTTHMLEPLDESSALLTNQASDCGRRATDPSSPATRVCPDANHAARWPGSLMFTVVFPCRLPDCLGCGATRITRVAPPDGRTEGKSQFRDLPPGVVRVFPERPPSTSMRPCIYAMSSPVGMNRGLSRR